METIDEGLTINSNTAMNGVEMVFGWGYSYSSSLVEAPQQFNTFSLAISTKNLSDETAHPKPNPFLSGHNNKRRPTHIVNLLFIMKLVIQSARDIDVELVVMNIAMGHETMHNGATIQHILYEATELQDWFQTLRRELCGSVIAVNKQHA